MTTAHNFPDISISPIRVDDDDMEEDSMRLEVPDSSNDTSPPGHSRNEQNALLETLPVHRRSILRTSFSQSYTRPRAHTSARHETTTEADDERSVVGRNGSAVSNVVGGVDSSIALDISLDSTHPPLAPPPSQLDDDGHPIAQDEGDSFNFSSEDAFLRLERDVFSSFLQMGIRDSADVGGHSDDSAITVVLRGVRAFVDLRCCLESSSSVKSKLRRMGAVVSRAITATTTHVIFTRGGDKTTLETVLSMENRPFLLDPHWVHDCWFNASHVPEAEYSLYGGRYLVESLRGNRPATSVGQRRSAPPEEGDNSDCIELSPPEDHQPASGNQPADSADQSGQAPPTTSFSRTRPSTDVAESVSISENSVELTFDQPMTATQLLSKIDKLSKRLDKVATDDAPQTHGPRCMSRCARVSHAHPSLSTHPSTSNAATNTKPLFPASRQDDVIIRRRRTHGAFSLPQRAPHSIAIAHRMDNRDEANALSGIRDITNRIGSVQLGQKGGRKEKNTKVVTGVDDMRKTTETNLTVIRKTLRNNAEFRTARPVRLPQAPPTRQVPRPIREEEEENDPMTTPTVPSRRRPLISTASGLINRLQCVPSSDEFAAGPRQSRLKKNRAAAMGIVFTGLSKREESGLRDVAKSLLLKPQPKIDKNTRCVVSGSGLRTLSTLRAIVAGVSVVNVEWLSACEDEQRLIPFRSYEFEQWKRVIKERGSKSTLFSRLGKILILPGCAPPAEDLQYLIRASGGKTTSCLSDSSLLIGPSSSGPAHIPWQRRSLPPPPMVGEKYILDCITRNTVLLYAPYLLETSYQQSEFDSDSE